jgi:hypothetical protein
MAAETNFCSTKVIEGLKGQIDSAGKFSALTFSDDTVQTTAAGGGGGDVTKVDTPVDNQLGVWTGDGTLEGVPDLTYDGVNLIRTPTADDEGIKIFGYDDKSASFGRLYIDSGGDFNIDVSAGNGIEFDIDGTKKISITTGVTFETTTNNRDNNLHRFGTDNDFSIGYSTAQNNLQINVGGSINSGTVIGIDTAGIITFTPIASPTTDADGEFAIDIDAWAANHDGWEFYDGTGSVYSVATAGFGSTGQVPKKNADGTVTWQADATGAGSGAFSDAGDPVVLNTTSKNVEIGDTGVTLDAKLQIGGDADEVQLIVEGHSTQTDSIFIVQKDDETQLFTVDNDGVINGSAEAMSLARIAGSTFSTVQHLQDIFHSAGWVSGGGITDDADGTITVAAGIGLIRASVGSTGEILFFDWAAEAGANVNLADNDISYIYAEYTGGSPTVFARTTESNDFDTKVLLAVISREGTDLHINEADRHEVGDHSNNMIRRLKDTMPYGHVTGGILSAPATVKIALTAGEFWRGLTDFTTSAVDTTGGGGGTFSYYYNSGAGWQKVATQTDIDNTQRNDFGVGLTDLSNNKYGVHWVYLEADDDDIAVVYGTGDYTLSEAEDAQAPSSIPQHLEVEGILAGKIIIKKGDSAFTQIESAFQTTFQGSLATAHNTLAGLQGGTTDEFYHMTSAQNTVIGNTSGTNTGDNTVATSGDSATAFFSSGAIDNVRLNLTAGRSLTESTNDILADAELYTVTKTIIIETPTSADNFIMFHVELGMQVTAAHAIVEDATNATVQFLQCDSAGDNCTEITSPIVAVVTGAADDGVIDAPDLDVDDWVRCNITATTGTPGHVTATLTMTMDD